MNELIDISNVVLKTERLILRPFTLEDLNDFYEYARVDGVGQMAGWIPHQNIEKSKQILLYTSCLNVPFAMYKILPVILPRHFQCFAKVLPHVLQKYYPMFCKSIV